MSAERLSAAAVSTRQTGSTGPRTRNGGGCYELVVGRVERGAFASALSGFGVVPVHPPLPYAARIRRPSRALTQEAPRAPLPLEPDKVVSRVASVRRFGCRACRFAAPISDTWRDRSGGVRARPAWVEQASHPRPIARLCDTPTRDTTLSCSISEHSRRALLGGL